MITKKPLLILACLQLLIVVIAIAGIINQPVVEPWIKQGIAVVAVVSILLFLAAVGPAVLKTLTQRFFTLIFGTPITSRLIIILLVTLTVAGFATIISRNPYRLPPLWAYLPLIMLWPGLVIALLVRIVPTEKHRASFFVGLLVRLAVSVTIFLVMLEVLLQVFITHLPWTLVGTMPQIRAMQQAQTSPNGELSSGDVHFRMNGYTGDLYAWICPSDADKEPTVSIQYTQDDHGFRNPMPWPDKTDLVVVGDSFVAAPHVQHPFWEHLSPSMLELGIPGIGNTQELGLLQKYGLPRSPKVVVMTYFEGNDITDNWTYHLSQSGTQPDQSAATTNIAGTTAPTYAPWDYLVTYHLLLWARDQSGLAANCINPIRDNKGKSLVFSTYYTSLLSMDTAALRQSAIFAATRDSIVAAAKETHDADGTFVLMFIPEKLHAHWNGVVAAGQLTKIMSNERVVIPRITAAGLGPDLDLRDPVEMAKRLASNVDGQRQLLKQLADDTSFLMLDLTPDFQKAVDSGVEPYFYGDSHWNQEGHDLAGKLLRQYLTDHGLLQ